MHAYIPRDLFPRYVKRNDFMAVKNFGVLLDCSRNAVMKTENILRFVDKIKKLGYNLLELYTEDTYALDGEEYFGYGRGRYSKTEMKAINTYCVENGVELVPCIETLGHLEKIFEWEHYAPVNDCDGVLLVGDERTYALIDKMFAFCADCFTSRKINIGMDEAHRLGLGNYLRLNGYKNRFDIFLRHLERVTEIAKKYGFKPMIWSDMFFRIATGGEYVAPDSDLDKELLSKVPEGVAVAYWDYFTQEEAVYEKMLKKHFEFGREVWFAGSAVKCCGFHSANEISLDRLSKSLGACAKQNVENILITLWSDGGAECSATAVLPTLTYAAEAVKGNYDVENAKKVFGEVFKGNWDDFLLCDLSDMPFPRQDDIGTGAKEMLYSDYFCGRFNNFVSLTGKERKTYARYAEKFAEAAERNNAYGYLFRFYCSLSKVLAEKYDLGALSRFYYRSGQKNKLKKLIGRYKKVEKLLPPLIEAFKIVWMKENKPHGFETHEIKLGGLLERTKSCRKRIAAYVTGEIDGIEELEDDFIAHEPMMPYKNSYVYIASVNTI